MLNAINANAVPRGYTGDGGKPPAAFAANAGSATQQTLHINALAGGGWRTAGGIISVSVFKAEGFSKHNPIMLVKGTDADGTPFEAEINAHEVNPRNASIVEMFALDGYFASNGRPANATRAASRAMAAQEALTGTTNAIQSAFSKFDFLTLLTEELATHRSQGNWEAFAWLNPIVENLANHAARR